MTGVEVTEKVKDAVGKMYWWYLVAACSSGVLWYSLTFSSVRGSIVG